MLPDDVLLELFDFYVGKDVVDRDLGPGFETGDEPALDQ